jgi:quinol-cytochrome oxidoreductase complex cytochrome b subunit
MALGIASIQSHLGTLSAVAVLARAEERTPAEKVLGWLLAAAAGEFALLVVSGGYLYFFYRPGGAGVWRDSRVQRAVRVAGAVQLFHRNLSHLMVLTVISIAIVGLILKFARSLSTRRHGVTAAAAVGICLVGLFGSFSGYLLPWRSLALWAVTVGTDLSGVRVAFGHQVQYVLIGGSSISTNTYRWWVYVHLLVVPTVLFTLGVVAARRLWHRRESGRGAGTGLGRDGGLGAGPGPGRGAGFGAGLDEPGGHTGLG